MYICYKLMHTHIASTMLFKLLFYAFWLFKQKNCLFFYWILWIFCCGLEQRYILYYTYTYLVWITQFLCFFFFVVMFINWPFKWVEFFLYFFFSKFCSFLVFCEFKWYFFWRIECLLNFFNNSPKDKKISLFYAN